jgi:CubicO group peptidase (beta-lactamase class C family)
MLNKVTLTTMHGESMTWPESLMRTYFDGIVVMHRGAVVYEDYFGEGAPHRAHMLASVSKSFVGTVAAMLVHEGTLDDKAPVPTVLPELKSSAYANATVRDVMDMLIGVVFSEDYADQTAGIWDFCRAGGVLPAPPGYAGPRSFAEFMVTTRQEGPHDEAFAYKTINTQVLSWIIERATGMSLAEVIATKLWSRLGMENDAYISIDSTGAGFGGGGMSTTLRDLARFGEMMRNDGACGSQQVVPEAVVADIRRGGDPAKFHRAEIFRPTLPGWSYRNMWWVSHNAHGAYQARGVHGQCIYVDPTAEMVITRFGSHPIASGIANDPITLPAFAAVADALMAAG